ncbi:MAG: metal-dependent transcriptional regulator [Chitinophagales bacterium]|nr:metal-dependent transcriptional regulator [Chitinophagales bacterium]MDW8428509.1 metal-dependent transcriptional regulator [Chitinophagales bacterium]
MPSSAEDHYLKHIYLLTQRKGKQPVWTNELAEALGLRPASVTGMLQRLAAQGLIHYRRYQGVQLTRQGKHRALAVIRKHRLWEFFLVEKLKFSWHEVHQVADLLEHVDSELLISRLDAYLGYPRLDPHGDPIPDAKGRMIPTGFLALAKLKPRMQGIVAGVADQQSAFLKHLERLGLHRGVNVLVTDVAAYDGSMQLLINQKQPVTISHTTAQNILVKLT